MSKFLLQWTKKLHISFHMLEAYVIKYACEYVWFDILSKHIEISIIVLCIDQS